MHYQKTRSKVKQCTGRVTTLAPLRSLNYNHLRKSTHIVSKYHQCRTPVQSFTNLSKYLIPEIDYSNGRVLNPKIRQNAQFSK